MKKKDFDFFEFLVAFITLSAISYGLTLGSENPVTFIVAYSVICSVVGVWTVIYIIPMIRHKINPEIELDIDPGMALLRGKDGSRLTPKKKELTDRIRRNRV